MLQAARRAPLQDDLRAQLTAVRPDLAGEGVPKVTIEAATCRRIIQFQRYRRKAGDDGGRRLAGTFRLTFPRPVRGPLALGWSSHFGMGLFMPILPRAGRIGMEYDT